MPYLGAHLSIAGGHHKALETAHRYGMRAVQFFTKNNTQWYAKPISPTELTRFHQTRRLLRPRWLLAHSSYLINLASPDPRLFRRSLEAFIEEWQRANLLGLHYLVLHPGAHTGTTELEALNRVADALAEARQRCADCTTHILLENTAGQGTALGWRLEHLQWIAQRIDNPSWLGFCIDTCHLYAAGYPLAPRRDWLQTLRQLDQHLRLERIRAWHLNDSARPLGSRIDRHAHIGYGKIGLEGFRQVLRCRAFRRLPMILETPKGDADGTDWDAKNLESLRRLLA